jgi:periplasmic protein CpxP/Spy
MKKICLFALLSVSALTMATGTIRAQSADSTQVNTREPKSAEERAQALTKRMEKTLALSADQTSKVEAINLEKSRKIDALRGKYTNDRRQGFQEMRTIRQEWDNELKAVLSADQFTKYQQLQAERRQKFHGQRKGRHSNSDSE